MQDSVNGAHNRLPVKPLDISLGISSDFRLYLPGKNIL
jgi:hypothetical protein